MRSWPRLMLITDGRAAAPGPLVAVARAACAAGAPLTIQVREKKLPATALLRWTRTIRDELAAAGIEVPLMINGRLDVALAAGARGVHLPAAGPPPARVRAAVGAGLAVGISTHSAAEVQAARQDGVDYILFGPVFATPSKAGMGPPQGLARLAEAARAAAPVPLLAVGGVTPENAAACRAAGARGVAVIRALAAASDPAGAARALFGAEERR